jgi:hypothetical protein
MNIIEKFLDKPWNWNGTSYNPNITIEFIEKYSNNLYFCRLSENEFRLENKRLKTPEAYWLFEKTQTLNRTVNLVILDRYM